MSYELILKFLAGVSLVLSAYLIGRGHGAKDAIKKLKPYHDLLDEELDTLARAYTDMSKYLNGCVWAEGTTEGFGGQDDGEEPSDE